MLQEEWRGEIVHLAWSPRAFLLKNFLSAEECEHLINEVSVIVCRPCNITRSSTVHANVFSDTQVAWACMQCMVVPQSNCCGSCKP